MIDKMFRKYGVEVLGEDVMATITDLQVETARCAAFIFLGELTAEFGKQEKGTVENLFVQNIRTMFLGEVVEWA